MIAMGLTDNLWIIIGLDSLNLDLLGQACVVRNADISPPKSNFSSDIQKQYSSTKSSL